MILLKWSNYIKNQLSVSPYWRKHNYVKLKISFLPFWIKKLSSLPFKVLIINEIILFLSDYFSFFFELFSIPVGIAELPVQFSTHFRLNKCEVLPANGNLSSGLFVYDPHWGQRRQRGTKTNVGIFLFVVCFSLPWRLRWGGQRTLSSIQSTGLVVW